MRQGVPNLWISIVCYNSLYDLHALMADLDGQIPPEKVILVDNGSVDGTREYVQLCHPRSVMLEQPRNMGFGAGHNLGMRRGFADGADYIMLLNPDIRLPRRFVQTILTALKHQSVAIGSALLWDRNGRELDLAFRTQQENDLQLESILHGRVRNALSVSVARVPGTAMVVHREVFLQLGGFEDMYFMYYEDLDLCRLVHQLGWPVHVFTQVNVRHRSEPNRLCGLSAKRAFWLSRGGIVYALSGPRLEWNEAVLEAIKFLKNWILNPHVRGSLGRIMGTVGGAAWCVVHIGTIVRKRSRQKYLCSGEGNRSNGSWL